LAKVNFELNSKNRGFLRFNRFRNDSPYNCCGDLAVISRSNGFVDRMISGAGQLATTISPNLLNELRIGVARREFTRPQNFNPSPSDAFINITGVANIGKNLGDTSGGVESSIQFIENLTANIGSHTLKAGMDYQTTDIVLQRALLRQFTFGGLGAAGSRPAV